MSNLRWTIGDVTITRIVEMESPMPLQDLLPEATPEALQFHSDWLQPHFHDGEGNCVLSIHALLIDSCGQRIIVDTCLGEHTIPGFEAMNTTDSGFLQHLADAGFPRESIDIVLCTHLHFDHVGWNTMRDGDRIVPTFPNARYLFAKNEWEHWNSLGPTAYTSTYQETVDVVREAGLVDLVEMTHRINDEIYLQPTTGHTPGHVSVCIESKDETAFITGDMTHHPVQWAETSWGIHADSDADAATQTRKEILQQYADSDTLVIGTHYPAPTSGRLQTRGDGHIFKASES
jgi:glyoxylase-like metal-dependent hydrolase (beta-lactamase superfamily II)